MCDEVYDTHNLILGLIDVEAQGRAIRQACQSFVTARRTLAGVEAMAMLTKGRVRTVPVNDMLAQRAFVHRVFGVAS